MLTGSGPPAWSSNLAIFAESETPVIRTKFQTLVRHRCVLHYVLSTKDSGLAYLRVLID